MPLLDILSEITEKKCILPLTKYDSHCVACAQAMYV